MNQGSPKKRTRPHNPGVRDLVEAQRQFSSPPNREGAMLGFAGWRERGYLPHRDELGLVQFVTFRLNDTFPESLRQEWEYLWKIENERERRTELEAYLDKGHGECYLRNPKIAKLVEDAFKKFHGTRYELRAWVIMSNHAHVLFQVNAIPMSEILETWKKHTAGKANRLLKRKGAFWAAGYYDTFMRDAEHERKTVAYIEKNPTKAKLVISPEEWPWSSARQRDKWGKLQL